MKKITAILLSLLASICLLVHAVIPHHHHNKVAVAVINIENNHSHSHHSHDDSHSHDTPYSQHYHHKHNHHNQHQHNHHSEGCLVDESLIFSFREQQSNYNFSDDESENNIMSFCYTSHDVLQNPYIPENLILFYIYQDGIPPNIYVTTNGLRAPPFC